MMVNKVDNKRTIKVEVDGKEIELVVKRPDLKIQQAGQLVYSREFCRLVKPEDGKPGAIVRAALDNVLRSQGIWNDEKQSLWEQFQKTLAEGSKKLAEVGGGKLSDARETALNMRMARVQLQMLTKERNDLDLNTAEAQAENARFNYYVSVCTVYPDGKRYFKDEQDYLNQSREQVGITAAITLSEMLYNVSENFEEELPENAFLLKYKLAQKGDLHLIDKDGHLVDAKWRKIKKVGDNYFLVNDKGELVDEEGNLLDDTGKPKTVPFAEFEDDIFGPPPAAVEAKTVAVEEV